MGLQTPPAVKLGFKSVTYVSLCVKMSGMGVQAKGTRKRLPEGWGSVHEWTVGGVSRGWRAAFSTRTADGKRKVVTRTAKTKEAAFRKLEELREELGTLDHTGVVLGEHLRRHVERRYRLQEIAASTYGGQLSYLKVLPPALLALPLEKVQPAHIRDALATLDKKSASYRNHVRHFLQKALDEAVVSRTIRTNPVASVKVPRQRRQADEGEIEHKAWSASEAQALLQAAQGTRWEAFIHLGLAVGARPGELMALHGDDVDFVTGQLTIRRSLSRELDGGKSIWVVGTLKTRGSRRVLSVGPSTCEVLRVQLEQVRQSREAAGPLWQEHGLLFPSRVGTPFEHSNVKRALSELCFKAGIRILPPKSLRHTHITLAIRGGEDPHIVQRRAGHTTVMTTLTVYRHVLNDEKPRIGTDLQQLLGLPPEAEPVPQASPLPDPAGEGPRARRRMTLKAKSQKVFRLSGQRRPLGRVKVQVRLSERAPHPSVGVPGKRMGGDASPGAIVLATAEAARTRAAARRTQRH